MITPVKTQHCVHHLPNQSISKTATPILVSLASGKLVTTTTAVHHAMVSKSDQFNASAPMIMSMLLKMLTVYQVPNQVSVHHVVLVAPLSPSHGSLVTMVHAVHHVVLVLMFVQCFANNQLILVHKQQYQIATVSMLVLVPNQLPSVHAVPLHATLMTGCMVHMKLALLTAMVVCKHVHLVAT